MPSDLICLEAENMIIEQEVSSVPVYRAKYQKPTWPAGDSGATIGIGVDLGYTTHADLEHDWGPYLPASMIATLHQAVGIKGERAHTLVRSGVLAGVVVSWEAAIAEFEQVEIPTWVRKTNKTYPGLEKLGPYCEGALVSLCFNRGTQLIDAPGSNRRLEMRQIKEAIVAGHPEKVPHLIRQMKRLWTNGLVKRREVEAQLFEKGLAQLQAQ
jgi:GH24 family phage-related lysozyme (muramidase)